MDLLHRVGRTFETALRERDTARAMGRLSDRGLADIGIARDAIRPVARIAARSGRPGASLAEVFRRLEEAEAARAARVAGGATEWPELPTLTRGDLAEFVEEGRRWRAEETDKLLRSLGRGLARLGSTLAGPVVTAVAASVPARRVELALLRRRELRRVRAELETYSERELTTDLRMNRSQIVDAAAEEADRRVEAFVRAHREYRQAWRAGGRRGASLGYADG